MRPLDLTLARPLNERGRIVAQDRIGDKEKEDGRVPPVQHRELACPV